MRLAMYLIAVVIVAVTSFFIGNGYEQGSVEKVEKSANPDLELAARNYPRGSLDIPAQWFMMESLVGWEKMMFIFGYADNRDVCYHLVDTAREGSPDRNFRCEDAN